MFNDTLREEMGFSLFPYNSITVYMGVQYRTELTGPHHLVIFDSMFLFFFLALILSSHSLLCNTLLCDCIYEGSDFLDRISVQCWRIQVHVP